MYELKNLIGYRTSRSSVFITLFSSFIAFTLIPLIIWGFFYEKTDSIMKDNVNRYNIAMMEQIKQIFDGNLKEVEQIANQISFSTRLQDIICISNPPNITNTYQYIDLKNELVNFKRSNTFIYDFYIYFNKDDVILTSDMKTDSETFYKNFYSYKDFDYNSWLNIMKGYHYKGYIPSRDILAYLKPQKVITFLQTLPYGNKKEIKACLAIFIDESKIKKMLENVEWANDGYIYILDKDNQVIMSTGDTGDIQNEIDIHYSGLGNGMTVYKDKNGSEVMVYYAASQESGWKYITQIPKNVFMDSVNNMEHWIQNTIMVYLVLGFVLAFLLAYKNYSPVRKLIGAIFNEKNVNRVTVRNEYDFIKQSILEGMSENRKLNSIIYRQMPAVKSNFLLRLMQGVIDYSAVTKDTLGFNDIEFLSDYFAVIIIEIEDFGSTFSGDSESDRALVRFILTNIGNELVNEHGRGFVIELGSSRLALLVNFMENQLDKAEADLYNISEILGNTAQNKFEVFITAGISSIHKGICGIGESYKEASKAVDFKFVKGIGGNICFAEIKSPEQNYYYPFETELILINTVKTGDYNSVEKILDEVYTDNLKLHSVAPELGRGLFFNLLSTLIRIMNTTNIKFENVLPGGTNSVDYLAGCSTIEEMHIKIKMAFKLICNHISSNLNYGKSQLLEQITNYIMQNYEDNTLCLATIADSLDITPQYLSTFFKNTKGENISDFIARVRIERAKKLLTEGKLTIFEIAQSIGYTNDVGFIRVFKKIEGVTPGKYKYIISAEH